ncbi:cadherin-like domain-containing protein [Idiomarina loihiensis]|uniref:Ig-like domain-containing protein n=1 Tax=Idiomarina loihiensis TaxID=135577 RepID=UPI00129C44B5|nr:Ig-like domain-containing protein [Idiomarina loihiensis]MRJ43359.1 hypothetical protein [Idiomarina loihiensis]UTW31977.1 cadherin-like domain-containing protein [Idiomarina loihiensis]
MKVRNLAVSAIVLALLAACNDSDSEVNVAPVATADSSEVKIGNSVTIDVLANDSDENNDTLKVVSTTEPSFGVVTIASDSEVVYTPNDSFLGSDSFSYTVSDGEEDVSAEVTVSVYNEVVISGRVIDDPIPNAEVTIQVGESEVQATADADGYYKSPIRFTNNEQLVRLKASGVGEQQNVQLLSYLGNVGEAFQAAGEDGELTREEAPHVNVTNLTTAYTILAERNNGGEAFATYEEYEAAVDKVNSDEAIEVAAAIKLIVDDPSFAQPEGFETVVDLVKDSEGYRQFLEAVEQASPGKLDEVKQEILSDSEVAPIPSVNAIAGTYFVGFEAHPLLPMRAEMFFQFKADGTGRSSYVFSYGENNWTTPLTWSVTEDGKVKVMYDEPVSVAYTNMPTADLTNNEVILAACPSEVPVNFVTDGHTLQLKEALSGRTSVNWTDLDYYRADETVTCANQSDLQAPTNGALNLSFVLTKATASNYKNLSNEAVVGTWLLPIDKENTDTGIEELVFRDDSSFEVVSTGETATWSLSENGKEIVLERAGGEERLAIFDEADGFVSVRNQYTETSGANIMSFNFGYKISDPSSKSMTLYTEGDKYYTNLSFGNRTQHYNYNTQELKHFSSPYNLLLNQEPSAAILTDWSDETDVFSTEKATQWAKIGTNEFGYNVDPDGGCAAVECYFNYTVYDVTDEGHLIVLSYGRLSKLMLRPVPTSQAAP